MSKIFNDRSFGKINSRFTVRFYLIVMNSNYFFHAMVFRIYSRTNFKLTKVLMNAVACIEWKSVEIVTRYINF